MFGILVIVMFDLNWKAGFCWWNKCHF